ncbi:uncharacterized protein C8Q71DRAFT_858846 [Rhodofomes roseus]|uniref:Glucose receptor Git3 N-terminal domain-containing protein n=1 Tax=Rhodofomes roseus TaxID=34475 RepID=A0ABQ8KCV3_9APHY|nr:uncharacterized protein C8Q71DRAFT_858846 [Rhodofomes roseus]KAH9835192.1 hypothetical protein C8Q71DRAFT_858846 [Rhodofomes roseus]
MVPSVSGIDASALTVIYGNAEKAGIRSLVAAGALSGIAVFALCAVIAFRPPCYRNTHVIPIFVSLLCANYLQAIASMMDLQWLKDGAVEGGSFCSTQGVLKNAGNVAAAFWSVALSVHVFMLLFLRKNMSNTTCTVLVIGGWSFIIFVPVIGVTAVQTEARGPYFGPSGYWCWITNNYYAEQMFLEYFFEFVSAVCSVLLYTVIVLRVRGNLTKMDGKWCLRFVPRGQRWLLAITRDFTDTAMMSVAARMVWHPIAYTVCLLPVTIARFVSFGGHDVPFWATVLADFIFNLQGLVNVILVLSTRHLIPNTACLPMFMPRKCINQDSPEAYGITPFVMTPSSSEARTKDSEVNLNEKDLPPLPGAESIPGTRLPQRPAVAHSSWAVTDPAAAVRRSDSTASNSTVSSADSQTPILRNWHHGVLIIGHS